VELEAITSFRKHLWLRSDRAHQPTDANKSRPKEGIVTPRFGQCVAPIAARAWAEVARAVLTFVPAQPLPFQPQSRNTEPLAATAYVSAWCIPQPTGLEQPTISRYFHSNYPPFAVGLLAAQRRGSWLRWCCLQHWISNCGMDNGACDHIWIILTIDASKADELLHRLF